MLTNDQLDQAGKYCVELHNYYIQNYKKGQETIVQFKDRHFLVGDNIFISMTFSTSVCWISLSCAVSHYKSTKTSFYNILNIRVTCV
jgi:hypothetical protein